VAVELFFEVKYLKSTMFKGLIESQSNAEMSRWLEQLLEKMKQVRECKEW